MMKGVMTLDFQGQITHKCDKILFLIIDFVFI